MKKFLLTLSLIFIIFLISIPVFANGSFVDATYPYSVTIHRAGDVVYIIQTKKPFFSNGTMICTVGDYTYFKLLGGTPTPISGTSTELTALASYDYILESSIDVYNYNTKELIYETDKFLVSTQVINNFMTHLTNLTNLSIGILSIVILIFCYFVSNSIFGLLRKG